MNQTRPASPQFYPDGYPSLAAFMASDHDKSALIFNRSERLSVRNLLYLQSELAELQKQLDDLDEKDRGLQSARNWATLKKRAEDEPERWDLIHKVRDTMRLYSMLLIEPHLPDSVANWFETTQRGATCL